MKAIVFGLGSMGKRRIRLLGENFDHITIIGIDTREDRRLEAESLYSIKTYDNINQIQIEKKKDLAFICTSPTTHALLIKDCLKKGLNIFTEINLLCDEHLEIIEMAERMELKLFLSSTMLYRREIQYICKKALNSIEKIHYTYHVGQYLPDWHPWENYESFFVSDVKTNGCREIFAIELPWIIKAFGRIAGFSVKKDKLTGLKLNYPDSYLIILEHESGHKGVLHVDIVSRKPVRILEMVSENLYLTWDGQPDGLKEFNIANNKMIAISLYDNIIRNNQYSCNIIEDAYLEEIKDFIYSLKQSWKEPCYTMREERQTLLLIDEIEGD